MSTTNPTSLKFAPLRGTLEVSLLGLVDYDAVLGLQEQNTYELSGRDDLLGRLLLCEHPPIITMGREASRSHIRWDDEELERSGMAVRWVSRGGGAFVHAPGQLAIYLQVPLDRLGLGISGFRERLEQALLLTCREFRISAKRSSQEPGVWSRGGILATFGAGVKSWVTCQGMFLNVATDPRLLSLTQPGPSGVESTSLQAQRLEPVRMPQVREAVVRHISQQFDYDLTEIFTGHPLLRRSTRKVIVHV